MAYLLKHWRMLNRIAEEYPNLLTEEARAKQVCIHDFFGE